jgi:hypothetical protein
VCGETKSPGLSARDRCRNGFRGDLGRVPEQDRSQREDNPPRQGFEAPPLIGDQFTFASDLLTQSGKRAGSFGATCIFTRGGVKGMAVCYGIYSLKGGQIMGIAKATDTNTTQVAVVGGTGAYANVAGTATEVSRGDDSPFADVTIRLIYP